jgi:hypothetical protein
MTTARAATTARKMTGTRRRRTAPLLTHDMTGGFIDPPSSLQNRSLDSRRCRRQPPARRQAASRWAARPSVQTDSAFTTCRAIKAAWPFPRPSRAHNGIRRNRIPAGYRRHAAPNVVDRWESYPLSGGSTSCCVVVLSSPPVRRQSPNPSAWGESMQWAHSAPRCVTRVWPAPTGEFRSSWSARW